MKNLGIALIIVGLSFTVLGMTVVIVKQKNFDYSIDIYDNGDGMIILNDFRTNDYYKIPFDSLEEKIVQLNE